MNVRKKAIEILLGTMIDLLIKRSTSTRNRKRQFSTAIATDTIVLTGTFYSDSWLLTHVAPLAAADGIEHVYMVATRAVPDCPGVTGIYPGKLSRFFLGKTLSRLILFHQIVRQKRPMYAGGFHLLLNGLVALLSASAAGVRSMYFCGGGEREVRGGGYATENRLFRVLGGPSYKVQQKLLKSVNLIDMTLVMGSGAKRFFVEHGVTSKIVIQPGGIDPKEFQYSGTDKKFDLVFVGRFSTVKRVDLFLTMLSRVLISFPQANAVLVGDGPLLEEMKRLAESLGIQSNTKFVGWSNNVAHWFSCSRIFVMTSESEGLSQALIQAGLCGLPSIVTNVGDLSDLITHGMNGYLIENATTEEISARVELLLSDNESFARMSRMSTKAARDYTIDAATSKWNAVLGLDRQKA